MYGKHSKLFIFIIWFIPHNYSPQFTEDEPTHGEAEQFAQGRTAGKQQAQIHPRGHVLNSSLGTITKTIILYSFFLYGYWDVITSHDFLTSVFTDSLRWGTRFWTQHCTRSVTRASPRLRLPPWPLLSKSTILRCFHIFLELRMCFKTNRFANAK